MFCACRFHDMCCRVTFNTGVELCGRSLLLGTGQFTFVVHLVTHPSSWHKRAHIKHSEALVKNGKLTVSRWPGHPQHTRYCELPMPFFPSSGRIKPLFSSNLSNEVPIINTVRLIHVDPRKCKLYHMSHPWIGLLKIPLNLLTKDTPGIALVFILARGYRWDIDVCKAFN